MTRYLREGSRDKALRTQAEDAKCANIVLHTLGAFELDYQPRDATAASLTGIVVNRYREQRKTQGVRPTTIARELAVASAACRWAISEACMDIVNPFAGRLMTKADRRAHVPPGKRISEVDQARLIAAATQPMADIIAFAFETGMRLSEIRLLTHDRIEGRKVTFMSADQKSRRRGVRALSTTAAQIVDDQHSTVYVFEISAGQPLSYGQFDHAWRKARAAVGVICGFHDIRRTFAMRARDRGVSMEDIAAQLGHESVQMTEKRYAIADARSAMRAVSM
jgi:integrase